MGEATANREPKWRTTIDQIDQRLEVVTQALNDLELSIGFVCMPKPPANEAKEMPSPPSEPKSVLMARLDGVYNKVLLVLGQVRDLNEGLDL